MKIDKKKGFVLLSLLMLVLVLAGAGCEGIQPESEKQEQVKNDDSAMMQDEGMMGGAEDGTLKQEEGMMDEEDAESMMEDSGMMDEESLDSMMMHDEKEFSMDSFTEIRDEKYFPQFSVKEITVKKGDRVTFHINTKSGKHSFKIDEFNVFADTPTGQITDIEFVADKAGEFIYYCAMPGHREAGHWGTLKVVE